MSVAEEELIHIFWHVDRSGENVLFQLVCHDPGWEDLLVSVPESDGMTERRAKAVLMQEMYDLGMARGIPPQRLRFKINGIEE